MWDYLPNHIKAHQSLVAYRFAFSKTAHRNSLCKTHVYNKHFNTIIDNNEVVYYRIFHHVHSTLRGINKPTHIV